MHIKKKKNGTINLNVIFKQILFIDMLDISREIV